MKQPGNGDQQEGGADGDQQNTQSRITPVGHNTSQEKTQRHEYGGQSQASRGDQGVLRRCWVRAQSQRENNIQE
ncbi:MAG TPA: hypothetical protein VEV17_24840 [Bryobacteraceae bacterium]|nr:hypothetical protein [Bryobacteraceae bacterium]